MFITEPILFNEFFEMTSIYYIVLAYVSGKNSFPFCCRKEKMNTVDIFGRMIQDFKQRTKNRLFIATRVTENMVNRFTTLIEDVQRVNKRVTKWHLSIA